MDRIRIGELENLDGEFRVGSVLTDPASPTITIKRPNGTTFGTATPTKLIVGFYRYAVNIPTFEPLGVWSIVWSGILDGQQVDFVDVFEVVDAALLPSFDSPAVIPDSGIVGGEFGIQGPKGDQGDPGPTGPAGADGLDGNDGWSPVFQGEADGLRWVNKVIGWTGGSGIAPTSGVYLGTTGFVGTAAEAINIRGVNGPSGAQGPQGIQGPIGPAGPQGLQGLTGAQGPVGDRGATGPTGATGPQGGTGPAGPIGPTGATGPAGADGNTVLYGAGAPGAGLGVNGNFYINTTIWTIYGPKTGGGWGSPSSLVGPTGSTGAVGPTGATGPTGASGATGATGATGPAGNPNPDVVTAQVNTGASQTVPDVSVATIARYKATANTTLTLPTVAAGKSGLIEVEQDATGSRTVTFAAPTGSVFYGYGSAPVASTGAGKRDLFSWICIDGTNYVVAPVLVDYR